MRTLNAIQWPAVLITVIAAWMLAKEVQTELGLLAFPIEQSFMDRLGSP
jgi:hypothetical protein